MSLEEIDALYRQGKARLQAKQYGEALTALRKARLMYASHYKDTDALIVEAQTAMQKENWQTRPQVSPSKKGCFLLGGMIALIATVFVLSGCASPAPAPAAGNTGAAAKITPQQRRDMY